MFVTERRTSNKRKLQILSLSKKKQRPAIIFVKSFRRTTLCATFRWLRSVHHACVRHSKRVRVCVQKNKKTKTIRRGRTHFASCSGAIRKRVDRDSRRSTVFFCRTHTGQGAPVSRQKTTRERNSRVVQRPARRYRTEPVQTARGGGPRRRHVGERRLRRKVFFLEPERRPRHAGTWKV